MKRILLSLIIAAPLCAMQPERETMNNLNEKLSKYCKQKTVYFPFTTAYTMSNAAAPQSIVYAPQTTVLGFLGAFTADITLSAINAHRQDKNNS